jgi:hypothetical protein
VVKKGETGLWAGFFLPGRKKKRFRRNRRAEEHTSAVKNMLYLSKRLRRKVLSADQTEKGSAFV